MPHATPLPPAKSQQKVVLEAVLQLGRHVTAQELSEELVRQGLEIANVGAHLSALAAEGKLLRERFADAAGTRRARYGPRPRALPGGQRKPPTGSEPSPAQEATCNAGSAGPCAPAASLQVPNTARQPVSTMPHSQIITPPADMEPPEAPITTGTTTETDIAGASTPDEGTSATVVSRSARRHWLVEPYVPAVEVTLLTGGRRYGKGLLCAKLAALASRGQRPTWDLAHGEPQPMHHVLWVTSGEDTHDEITTRFQTAGGDQPRLTVVSLDRRDRLGALRDNLMLRPGPKLAILDPLQTAVGDLGSARVREHMEQLVAIARATATTVIAIRHVLKNGSGGRGRGEVADVVRSELIVGHHPDDTDLVVLGHLPSSYGEGDPVAFRVQPLGADTVLNYYQGDWDDDIDPVDLLPRPPKRRPAQPRPGRRAQVMRFLNELLTVAPHPRAEVLRLARRRRYSERTVERAADQLGVVRDPQRVNGQFAEAIWSLPPPPPAAPPPPPLPATAPEWHTAPPAEAHDLPALLRLLPPVTPPPPRTRAPRRAPSPPKPPFVARPEDPLWRHGLEVE